MWKNLQINIQNIAHETDRAILINCPHKSDYDGYQFWHPSKLVRRGSHSYAKSIGYTDDFTFTLRKMGKGKHNFKDVIAEKQIGVAEFERMFGVMSENITEPKIDSESYVCVSEPEKIEVKAEIPECLQNN